MWGGSSKRRNIRIDTLVGRNTTVTGDLRFTGGLHVDGRVKGNVVSEDHESVLSLSEHGQIHGEVLDRLRNAFAARLADALE